MYEMSKATVRRTFDSNFVTTYFRGEGIDIGAGPDGMSKQMYAFPLITSMDEWDIQDGDAQYMGSVPDNTYDFVVSSHCLEHLVDPFIGIRNWVRICKPGGFLIVVVPDWWMYERGYWPSRFNSDHKHRFTICRKQSSDVLYDSTHVINLVNMVQELDVDVIKLEKITKFYDDTLPREVDQTRSINRECAIEMILQKES